MINRAALILRCKDPFVRWVNEADPYYDDPGITIERVNRERIVYLIDSDAAENVDEWISKNFTLLFETELDAWYADEALWPKNRNKKLFDKWFDVECHSIIFDTLGGEIVDDEI